MEWYECKAVPPRQMSILNSSKSSPWTGVCLDDQFQKFVGCATPIYFFKPIEDAAKLLQSSIDYSDIHKCITSR